MRVVEYGELFQLGFLDGIESKGIEQAIEKTGLKATYKSYHSKFRKEDPIRALFVIHPLDVSIGLPDLFKLVCGLRADVIMRVEDLPHCLANFLEPLRVDTSKLDVHPPKTFRMGTERQGLSRDWVGDYMESVKEYCTYFDYS